MADETQPTEKVKKAKRTPEEKAARQAQREKKLANMSPRQIEKQKESREKRKAAKQQKRAAQTEDSAGAQEKPTDAA